ncbi:hypothetical protein Pd630_LPD07823 [Rhodococcus opacus PD630]|nr:hypothetical protein Pd630_LPD07823 [Rhodococcus opacus PD630]
MPEVHAVEFAAPARLSRAPTAKSSGRSASIELSAVHERAEAAHHGEHRPNALHEYRVPPNLTITASAAADGRNPPPAVSAPHSR